MKIRSIYLIGALKNPKVITLENELRARGYDPFSEWINPGIHADEYWQKYEKRRGRTYAQAIKSYHARHVFAFDLYHINRCDAGVLVMPAGKSACLELGYFCGQKKPAFVLFDREPRRFDLMFQFATGIFFDKKDLFKALRSFNK